MADIYTNGSWQPYPGSEHAFVDAWKQFATWASSMPGAGRLTLVRDLTNQERFTSFGRWESIEQAHAWKSSSSASGSRMSCSTSATSTHPSSK
jgi:heme-degrading monooxygenase HmoA